jgi:hypothetical protein
MEMRRSVYPILVTGGNPCIDIALGTPSNDC